MSHIDNPPSLVVTNEFAINAARIGPTQAVVRLVFVSAI
jgi:hypothetical protein